MHSRTFRRAVTVLFLWACGIHGGDVARYRTPAPLEDGVPQVALPVFGSAAGHAGSDRTFHVMEWVAKRAWHVLDLPYERADFKGPPAMEVAAEDGWIVVRGTLAVIGLPLRNQIVTCEVEEIEAPLLLVLRSTDSFGELLIELDLALGRARARAVGVSRSMQGGRSHSSPMPEQSWNRVIAEASFVPVTARAAALRLTALGSAITLEVAGARVLAFDDPDPAGGKFGAGSAGTMRIRNVQIAELVSEAEKRRREACHAAMETFARDIDARYEGEVRARNLVEAAGGELAWHWPATGASARFRIDGPHVRATVRAGLYGDDLLIHGAYPEVAAVAANGELLAPDREARAAIEGEARAIRMALPLRSAGGMKAVARVTAELTVQTVWFWTVAIEGAEVREAAVFLALAPAFALAHREGSAAPVGAFALAPCEGASVLRHNAKAGIFVKALAPEAAVLGAAADGRLGVAAPGARLRFATSLLPAQKLNPVGFAHRMLHYIRYPEGPVEAWRRGPSAQEYPTDADLARYAANGADAMVWHHTWLGNDYRDREGFFVDDAEMARAMRETHRLGMKTIGYLGIVPGRNALLDFSDTCALGRTEGFGSYEKNWDLQDFTFYSAAGRYPEFLAWMTDYLCKRYALDGYYLDGGAFGAYSRGGRAAPLRAEDAGLSLDELQHRAYWRVKKVLELNGARYGLEPWSGLDWMLNGFYDCMMIGESFQEAPPEYYRDGHNALLTGCAIKMYGMRESSQNPYNIAMAAVNLGDIQVCSGNGAWGDDPDTAETWARVGPLWRLLDSIAWPDLIEARPWYAQELVAGEGFYAANYTEARRAMILLANKTETPGKFEVAIDAAKLPRIAGAWHLRYCLGRAGDIGRFTGAPLQVELPALHGGPIGIELTAAETGAYPPRALAPAGAQGGEPRDAFVPSTKGKKLLLFNGPVAGAEGVAFDGVITGGPLPFLKKLDPKELDAWVEKTARTPFGRHTDNFYLCYSYPGKTAEEFDWFDDLGYVVENFRLMAAAAKKTGMKGMCFDSEYYEGLPPFGYARMRHKDAKTFEEYRAQVRRRGAEIMAAVEERFPDVTMLVLFGFSGSYCGVPQHPISRAGNYTLVSAFVDGLLSACGPRARVFDMHEQSFSFRVEGSFARARAMMTEIMPALSAEPERYRAHHRAGFSFWADCWENAREGRALDVERFERNYYTPDEFAYALNRALAYSDQYVWMWPGVFDFFGGTVRTVNAEGKDVVRPLPRAYLDALARAHEERVAPPPRERLPNTYRVVSASTQEGFADEATFGDLRATHEFLEDLPREWRFKEDPDEVGEARSWHASACDDGAWRTIRIGEFWEMQGLSPYDGAAWYRLRFAPAALPAGRKVYLAFGAVADEAAVYVDGERLFASRRGENMRHVRFLVDVTGRLDAAAPHTIAVRVWNTCWCGGIWKSVKLVAER